MRTLYILRHAKAKKDHEDGDFFRKLSKKGKEQARLMGDFLVLHQEKPDLIVASPAKRTKKTAETVAEAVGYPEKEILWDQRIYNANLQDLVGIAENLPNRHSSAMMVGHNPGFSGLAHHYLGYFRALPTCGGVRVDFEVDTWQAMAPGIGREMWFEAPEVAEI